MKAILKFIVCILFYAIIIKAGLVLYDLYGTCIFSKDFFMCKKIEELNKWESYNVEMQYLE